MRSRAPRPLHALAAIVVLAAALRLWRIGHQSYWLDEAFTVGIVRRDLGGMLDAVRHTESTPPLYYALAWLWERAAGWHEAGLRSLSALFGIATVPVAYAAARELFTERAALIAAALVAVNPYLVWYSQEARAYALLVLLCGASLLYFLRAERDGSGAWRWAAISALALLTHYFAALLIAPEAAWLLWRHRSRAIALAAAIPLAAAAALLPLALAQRSAGHTLFIADIPFGRRLVSVPKKLATGELGTTVAVLGPAIGAVLAAGAAAALAHRASRRGAALLLGLAATTVAIALALKLAGLDYVFPRNLIGTFVPVLIAIGAGFGAFRLGPAAAAVLAIAGVALAIQVGVNPRLQRDDWRGAVRALGPATSTRALVVTPGVARTPVAIYARRLSRLPRSGADVGEVDVIAGARPPRFAPPAPPPPGFRLLSVRTAASWEVVRYVAPSARLLGPNRLRRYRLERARGPAVLVQRAGS